MGKDGPRCGIADLKDRGGLFLYTHHSGGAHGRTAETPTRRAWLPVQGSTGKGGGGAPGLSPSSSFLPPVRRRFSFVTLLGITRRFPRLVW